jgi:hypothetical protein
MPNVVIRRPRGRPRKDGTPAQPRRDPATYKKTGPLPPIPEEVRVEQVMAAVPGEPIDMKDRRPRKTINIKLLEASGQFLHPDSEAAAFQQMSPSWFSKVMRKRDPQSGLTYREIFTNARLMGRASLLRIAREHCTGNGSAAVQMTKFMLENEFGFTERRRQEVAGSVQHHHTHEAIPSDAELDKLSDRELAELMLGATTKAATKH